MTTMSDLSRFRQIAEEDLVTLGSSIDSWKEKQREETLPNTEEVEDRMNDTKRHIRRYAQTLNEFSDLTPQELSLTEEQMQEKLRGYMKSRQQFYTRFKQLRKDFRRLVLDAREVLAEAQQEEVERQAEESRANAEEQARLFPAIYDQQDENMAIVVGLCERAEVINDASRPSIPLDQFIPSARDVSRGFDALGRGIRLANGDRVYPQ